MKLEEVSYFYERESIFEDLHSDVISSPENAASKRRKPG
jgi:hypothetical protein